jgi:L-threonylcarbamoyladenylate synthase
VSPVEEAVAAIRAGRPVVLPFDTVYGLAGDPHRAEPTRRIYELKGRPDSLPSALVAADVDRLLESVPELRGRSETIARELLPGPYTLVFANPARRFPWLTGSNPATIGVRVPELAGLTAEVVARVGVVVATSANRHGQGDPATLGEVPSEIKEASVVVDGGRLPGTASTVIDFTGPDPHVVRQGAANAGEALRRLEAAVRST